MTIQKATRADLPAILELQYLAYQSEAKLVNDYSIPPLRQTLADVERDYDRGAVLKAVDGDGTIIGSVRAYVDNGTAFIGKLIVHPDRQGKGIGTKLLAAVEQEYPVARYELFTSNKSVRNIKLYERLGFTKFREQKTAPGLSILYLEKRT